MNDKPIEMVTLKHLCAELKVDPREARERLRLAVRTQRKIPNWRSHTSRGSMDGNGRRIHPL